MGLDLMVPRTDPVDVLQLLAQLAAAGLRASVLMVDGNLHAPQMPVPPAWRDLRLKTPAGAVSLKRRPDGIAVVVFGNADAALLAAQKAIADALQR
jgi:hypothetical protein